MWPPHGVISPIGYICLPERVLHYIAYYRAALHRFPDPFQEPKCTYMSLA